MHNLSLLLDLEILKEPQKRYQLWETPRLLHCWQRRAGALDSKALISEVHLSLITNLAQDWAYDPYLMPCLPASPSLLPHSPVSTALSRLTELLLTVWDSSSLWTHGESEYLDLENSILICRVGFPNCLPGVELNSHQLESFKPFLGSFLSSRNEPQNNVRIPSLACQRPTFWILVSGLRTRLFTRIHNGESPCPEDQVCHWTTTIIFSLPQTNHLQWQSPALCSRDTCAWCLMTLLLRWKRPSCPAGWGSKVSCAWRAGSATGFLALKISSTASPECGKALHPPRSHPLQYMINWTRQRRRNEDRVYGVQIWVGPSFLQLKPPSSLSLPACSTYPMWGPNDTIMVKNSIINSHIYKLVSN